MTFNHTITDSMIIVLFDPYSSLLRHIGLSNLKMGYSKL